MKLEQPTIAEYFIDRLKKDMRESIDNSSIAAMYYSLFTITGNPNKEWEFTLNYTRDQYHKGNEGWFYEFHKSIRQAGLFENFDTVFMRRTYDDNHKLGEVEYISGKLDSLLWHLISYDDKYIFNFMQETFEDYQHMVNKKKKLKKSK